MNVQRRAYGLPIVTFLVAILLTRCGQVNTGSSSDGDLSAVTQTSITPDTPVDSGTTGSQSTGTTHSVTLRGTVSTPNGEGLEGVLVTPESLFNPKQAIPEIAVTTDEQGRYTWILPVGSYTLTFTKDGYTTTSQMAIIQANQVTTVDVQIQLNHTN